MNAAAGYTLILANPHYSSWSLRPWLLMTQQGIDFQAQWFNFGPPFSSLAFHTAAPAGMVPVLHHDGDIIWDSLGIVEYLAERHPGIWPIQPRARAWARCASAEMHSNFCALRTLCPFGVAIRAQPRQQDTRLQGELERLQAIWQEGLERFGGPFLAGPHFSAVDAFYAPIAFRVQTYGLALNADSQAYVQRMLALPAMQQWHDMACRDPWRDPDHDAEVLRVADINQDLRPAS
ncbi:MAG TPA: glutathione S-transferase [Alcaligenes sp.]|nr:glutathione S-transferase [Alcaligenes sp.]HRL28084.1 glutathione S-transferase [Alcaligenes sp.]